MQIAMIQKGQNWSVPACFRLFLLLVFDLAFCLSLSLPCYFNLVIFDGNAID
jgi:hypothetical protein